MSSTVREASFIPKDKQRIPGPAFYFSNKPVENFKQKLL